MRCQSCGYDNPPGGSLCRKCGTPLAKGNASPSELRCARCGAGHRPGLRFCTECGNSLDAQPVVAPNPAESLGSVVVPPVCGRCQSAGDIGAIFCKFCGFRYGAAPPSEAPAPETAPPPGFDGQGPGTVRTAARATTALPARLVAIRRDGTDGTTFPLVGDTVDVGSSEGDVKLPDDPYLSPRHARIRRKGDTFVLEDLDSPNGIYLRIREPIELADREMILLGQQVIRFEMVEESSLRFGPAHAGGVHVFGTPEVPRMARLVQYTTEGLGRDVHYLYRDETVLGREVGDIVFTDDPFLSRRHASICIDRARRRCILRDLGSSNGTALRIRKPHTLVNGDQFRVGRHLLRFEAPESLGGRA